MIDIGDPMIVAKIHQTYRLLYLRDVILARVVDDPTVSILNSFIFFHQNDIVNYCCQNEDFLCELFRVLTNAKEPEERRSEGVSSSNSFAPWANSSSFQHVSRFTAH